MSDYDKKAVGERIRSRRKALEISQEDFAERIGLSLNFAPILNVAKLECRLKSKMPMPY